jgi:hypothetical protein
MEARTYEYEPVSKHNAETRRRQLYQRLLERCLEARKTSIGETKPEEIKDERKNSPVCPSVE